MVKIPSEPDREEQNRDWFPAFLKYQAMCTALFEYLIMEAENGRQ
jgi:hypothetical protein